MDSTTHHLPLARVFAQMPIDSYSLSLSSLSNAFSLALSLVLLFHELPFDMKVDGVNFQLLYLYQVRLQLNKGAFSASFFPTSHFYVSIWFRHNWDDTWKRQTFRILIMFAAFFLGRFFFHIHRIFYPLISWLSKHQFVNPMSILFLFFWKAIHIPKILHQTYEKKKKTAENIPKMKVEIVFGSVFSPIFGVRPMQIHQI